MRVLILFFIMKIALFTSCQNSSSRRIHKLDEKPLPNAEIIDFETRGYRKGHISWYIKAKKAEIYSDKKITILYKFHLYNYDKKGMVNSTASAKIGTMWEDTEDILLQGNVIVLNEDKTLLETNSLKYFRRENRILTKDRVKITRANGDILKGKGLKADLSLKRMELLSQVSGDSR